MATIIQKEILLDRVAHCLGAVSRKSLNERVPIQDELVKLREELYRTNHNNVDYEAMNQKFVTIEKEIQALTKPKIKISEAEYLKRKQAIDFTNNSFALEGFIPAPELVHLSKLYIQGEIDSAEFSKLSMEFINKNG